MNKLKVMLSFMRELSDNNIATEKDYKMDFQEFADIIEACQDEGLIKGAKIVRAGQGNKVIGLCLEQVKLTVKGLEYLNDRTPMMIAYKGIKEIGSWLTF